MSEQKRYTAQEMRETASTCETVEVADQFYAVEMDRAAAMLRQAADAEEELAKLKAQMEAVVKECERNEVSYRHDETFVEKIERITHNEPFLKILHLVRGRGGV